MGLYHLVQHKESKFDRSAVVKMAKELLDIPGLSVVAYRFSIYAIRDSDHKDTRAILKGLLKHSDKEVPKLAVKALMGVGKNSQ
jgi:hypothetical protein